MDWNEAIRGLWFHCTSSSPYTFYELLLLLWVYVFFVVVFASYNLNRELPFSIAILNVEWTNERILLLPARLSFIYFSQYL